MTDTIERTCNGCGKITLVNTRSNIPQLGVYCNDCTVVE